MARILLDNNEWAVKDDLSFFNISSEIIDLTDGTWTLLDPDSLVQSTSFASGFNTITWNALGAGSNDYVWTISTTHRAPRWYKLLKIDGNQITSDDFITFQANGKLDTSVLDFNHQIVYGICSDPTSTTAGTIDGAGALMSQNTTAQPKHGIWAENLRSENASNADNISQAAVLQRGKGMMIGGVSVSIDSGGEAVRPVQRTNTEALASTQNQYLMVGVGTNSAVTVASGNKQKFSLKMTVFTHDISF